MLSTAHTRTASFVLIVSAMIFTAYEAPLLTYVAFRTGLFDRAITNTTGVSVTLNSGWTLSPFTAWEILMGREPITGVVYFPLQFVYPWRSNEYVGVDRIKSPSIINGPKLHSLGKEVQIAGRKYFLISKSEGLAMTVFAGRWPQEPQCSPSPACPVAPCLPPCCPADDIV